ncbi:TonB-dependent receptor [Phenylobacterium sp.]|uniref:TonB-dependent receptor n=1 Tax=Phenylobacterium sp. TaxID=1871053 RepID=UPI002FE0235B
MKPCLLATAALAALVAAPALAQDTPLVDIIVVTAPRATTTTALLDTAAPRPIEGPDPTALLARIPGGARVGNGALSGQAQYRGLFGHRLNLRVDGQRFASGGPNLMDPPFHYAPTALLAALEVDRGVSPVRNGPGLAGGMNAVFKRVGFGDGTDVRLAYDLSAETRTADDSHAAGGIVGVATGHWRANLLGSYERGRDAEFPGGTIRASRYERSVHGLSAGGRSGGHEFALDLRRQHTAPTGNPPFPMDIRYFDADFARLGYVGSHGDLRLEAALSYAEVDHAMNNFDLRPAPGAMERREALAEAVTRSAEAAVSGPVAGGRLRVGADLEDQDRNVFIGNPMNPAFLVVTLPDVGNRRAGAYAEWTGPLGVFEGEFGLRADRHETEAGRAVTGPAVAAGPVMLAQAFNAADRRREDITLDAVARVWTPPREGLSWRLTLARKTRVAGYVERFGWLPTSTSGGLADGNIYVGDLDLEPEVAWIAEAGFDYADARAYIRPTVFLREVDNYIQGVAFDATPGVPDTLQERVAAMSGDPTPLRFANVDARLYGLDMAAGVRLDGGWRLDGVASYVRGERPDVADNLYRVSPPSLTAALSHDAERWSVTAETRVVADQGKVSRANSEHRTGGYALFSLSGDWRVADGVRLSAGVENLLDRRYSDHLAGHNQIAGSDVPLGSRLPGTGRSAFVRVSVVR